MHSIRYNTGVAEQANPAALIAELRTFHIFTASVHEILTVKNQFRKIYDGGWTKYGFRAARCFVISNNSEKLTGQLHINFIPVSTKQTRARQNVACIVFTSEVMSSAIVVVLSLDVVLKSKLNPMK